MVETVISWLDLPRQGLRMLTTALEVNHSIGVVVAAVPLFLHLKDEPEIATKVRKVRPLVRNFLELVRRVQTYSLMSERMSLMMITILR